MTPPHVPTDMTNWSFKRFSELHHLQIVAAGADRHGSIEWLATYHDDLERFLSFSLTPLNEYEVQMEVWISANNRTHSIRRRLSSRTINTRNPVQQTDDLVSSEFRYLEVYLESAWKELKAISVMDLTTPNPLLSATNPPSGS